MRVVIKASCYKGELLSKRVVIKAECYQGELLSMRVVIKAECYKYARFHAKINAKL